MPEPLATRERIRQVVYEWGDIDMATAEWAGGEDLAARLQDALFGFEPTGARLLTADDLEAIRDAFRAGNVETHFEGCLLHHPVCAILRLLEHAAGLDQVIGNQNGRMAEQAQAIQRLNGELAKLEGLAGTELSRRLRAEARLGELEAEVPRALHLTPLGEVMGRGVMADDVQRIAALLRPVGDQGEAGSVEEGRQ